MTTLTNTARKIPLMLGAINFQESLYALPFAYTGMLLAARGLPTLGQFVWITVAMVSARTVGMAANRIIDRHVDARNPRNAGRHLPSGRLRVADLGALTAVALVVFLFAAWQLNTLALALAPVAVAYLVFYPYTKRFTWAANLLLGWALAIAPSAAWIGVTGSYGWQPFVLSLAVATWAGSFDILYHTQDRDFYESAGLYSVARRFGVVGAFRLARALDVVRLRASSRWGRGSASAGRTTPAASSPRRCWSTSTPSSPPTTFPASAWPSSASTPTSPPPCFTGTLVALLIQ